MKSRGKLKQEWKPTYPLKGLTTFGIGGEAEYFFAPENTARLAEALRQAKKCGLRVFILGAGSNILIAASKLRGLVIKLSAPYFKKIYLKRQSLYAGAGISLAGVLRFAWKKSLSGFEFSAGIPGTVGGALTMNAGIPGKCIFDLLEAVRVMDYNGKTKTIKKDKIKFAYRKSGLDKYIILSAKFKLRPGKKEEIQQVVKQYLESRRTSQDGKSFSAGCVFKNPRPDLTAGELIDLSGLKGRRRGGAQVSPLHANFIVNRANAKAGDVLALMKLASGRVKNKFGIKLEPEIKIWQ